jgi:hypothetical protein
MQERIPTTAQAAPGPMPDLDPNGSLPSETNPSTIGFTIVETDDTGLYKPSKHTDPEDYIIPPYSEQPPLGHEDLPLSPNAASATRELAFISQYHDLSRRIANNPTPTDEELNMGAYVEEIEPQVRSAVITLRRKGYNTGSSGFYGREHVDQTMDVATPIDEQSKAQLSEYGITITDSNMIRFRPTDATDIEAITKTWDMIASILPTLGTLVEPAHNAGADMFRNAMARGKYAEYREVWLLYTGVLRGGMKPLAAVLAHEGHDFSDNSSARVRAAEHQARQLLQKSPVQY